LKKGGLQEKIYSVVVDVLKEAINKHNERCSLEKFNKIVEEFISGKEENFEAIVNMILYDTCYKRLGKR